MNPPSTCELLILADGRVLAHNLTSQLANVLTELNPNDTELRQRARPEKVSAPDSRNAKATTPSVIPSSSR